MSPLGLKTKITVLVSIMVACLLTLLTLVTVAAVEKQLKASISDQQGALTAAVAKELDYKISLYRQELVEVARSLPPSVLTDHAAAKRLLSERLDTISMFESGLFLVAPDGAVLASTVPTPPPGQDDCHFYEEIAQTVRAGVPRISEPYRCGTVKRGAMVLFSVPILGRGGEVSAVLAGRLDLLKENFLGEVAAAHVGKSGYYYIINRQRQLVVHPQRGRMLTTVAQNRNVGIDRALAGSYGTSENINTRGVHVLSTFQPLTTTGWLLSANYPLDEAYLPIERLRIRMLIALTVMVGAAVLLVGAALRHMLEPLSSFTRQVVSIAGDDPLPRPVRVDSRDEIGGLATAFNHLMADIAKHKDALRQEKEFELSLLQHSSLATFVIGADHRVLHWNQACEALTGVAAADVCGSDGQWRGFFDHPRPTLADIVLADGAAAQWYPLAEKRGEGLHAEGWYPHVNGDERYLSFYAAPIRGGQGDVVAVIETVEDITARKRTDEVNLHAVSMLNATLESTADGILVRDLAGKVATYNRNFAEMWQIPDELLATGDDVQLREYVKDQLCNPEEFFRTTEAGYRQPEDQSRDILELKDGRVFERVSRPQRVGDRIVGRVVSFRDITEREHAKQALWESIERYRSLVDNIDLGITLVDSEHRVVMTNVAAAAMFGKRPSDLVGARCFAEFEKRGAACRHCPGVAALASGKPETVQTEGVRDDGSTFTVRIRAFPVADPDGKPTAFIEVIQDISEQVQTEADKQLLEAQLRQSQKMEALGTMAGGVAHDFNNILTAILAYCSLIERKLHEGSPALAYLHKLVASTERASALTQSLLAYSRKQPIHPQPVALDEVVGKIAHLLSRLLGEDIELVIESATEPVTVLAEATQLGQVLMNLATNARDAMPLGGTLLICTDRVELDEEFVRSHGFGNPGSYGVLTVADTGYGMDAATRERIFEPFFTTKEVGKGTGLGLSVAYGIVKQHSGYIQIASAPGEGTTFTIYLPVCTAADAALPASSAAVRRHGRETILLVEDDAEIRATMKELLEQDGYRIIEAVDGEDGIAKYHEHRDAVQLLLLDVIMPKKNGRDVYEEIRGVAPDISALFISGYTADILHAKGVPREETNLIAKPVSIDKLLPKIRELLERPR